MKCRSGGAMALVGALLAFLTMVSFSGCASIIKGSSPQQVSFKTVPSEADCQLTDVRSGTVILKQKSPILIPLKRDAGFFKSAKYRYTCDKEGFKSGNLEIVATVNGWYFAGNLVFGGLIGYLIVDPATGAMWSFYPDDLTMTLESVAPVPASAGDKGAAPAAASAVVQKVAIPVTVSFFQGNWVGTWQYWGPATEQDVTITVGSKNADGTFDTEYSWGFKRAGAGERDVTPGTIKVKGRESGEKFVFEFTNPDSLRNNSVEMTKYEGEKVKIRMGGLIYNPDGYLKRK